MRLSRVHLLAIEVEEAAERRHPSHTAAQLAVGWWPHSSSGGKRLMQECLQLGGAGAPQAGHKGGGGALAEPVAHDRAQAQVRLQRLVQPVEVITLT